MSILRVNRLAKEYNGHFVFKEISFALASGEKVGLIGRNGSGKSVLLRIIAGREEPTSGLASLCLPPERVGYLPQEPVLPGGLTVKEYAAGQQPAAGSPPPGQWEVFKYLDQLGLGRQHHDNLTDALSGGEKSRLCLALLLGRDSGLLLLDEPTNHLDSRGLAWLEGYLKSYRGAALIVSHDRCFLDETVERIIELDRGEARAYPGGYSDYARIKEEENRARWNAYARYRREQKRIAGALQRKKQWAKKAAAAASPRTPYLAKRAKKVDRVVKSIERRLEWLEQDAPRKPWEYRRLRLNLTAGGRTGGKLIEAAGAGHAFGEKVILKEASFAIFAGDAAVLIGPNGSGKTTLLRLILGELQPARGRISLAPAALAGYMGQDHDTLDPALTPLETLAAAGESDGAAARHLLGALLIRGDQVHQPVASLSGGEKKRLELAALLARRVNLLILDEPTNHLDLESREAIEAALDGFDGTILAASHDRYFLHRLSGRVLALEDGRIDDYPGPYADYLESRRPVGAGHRDEVLVLENRLSRLAGLLDRLAGDNRPEAGAERAAANREFLEISRKIRELTGK